jgi:hypothetical protein
MQNVACAVYKLLLPNGLILPCLAAVLLLTKTAVDSICCRRLALWTVLRRNEAANAETSP